MNRAVFLDRDGVLVEDRECLTRAEDLGKLDPAHPCSPAHAGNPPSGGGANNDPGSDPGSPGSDPGSPPAAPPKAPGKAPRRLPVLR